VNHVILIFKTLFKNWGLIEQIFGRQNAKAEGFEGVEPHLEMR